MSKDASVSCYECKKYTKTQYGAPPPKGWFSVHYDDNTHGLYCSVNCFLIAKGKRVGKQ